MKKVIFDTDIGIDDAMALLFLKFAPDVDLQAIVTGFGNASVEQTTRNALYMKERFGIDAPVYRGAAGPAGPALCESYPDFIHGKNGLGDIEMSDPACEYETAAGAEAIVNLVRQSPGELSIVAVGRMTNIATALAIEPKLPQLTRELIVMGGLFGYNNRRGNVSPVAEANIAGDPSAADSVFSSGFETTIVGLDVTEGIIMDSACFERLRENSGDAGDFIHQISRCYLEFHKRSKGRFECPTHDSSAVAYLLRPELFTTTEAAVRVATEGIAMGQTIIGQPDMPYDIDAWKGRPTCRVCSAVDERGVVSLYLDTLALAAD